MLISSLGKTSDIVGTPQKSCLRLSSQHKSGAWHVCAEQPLQNHPEVLVKNGFNIYAYSGETEGYTWGLLAGSIIQTYFSAAVEPKYVILGQKAEQHR